MMPTAPSTEHIDRVAAVHALPFDSLFPCLQHSTAQHRSCFLRHHAVPLLRRAMSPMLSASRFGLRQPSLVRALVHLVSPTLMDRGREKTFKYLATGGLKAASRRGHPLSPMLPRLDIPASRFLSDKTSSSCLGRLLLLLPNIHRLGYCTVTVAWACGLLLLLATPTA